MDTGVDTDYPDLQGVLYEFTPEQQKRYGCGKYGFNASGDGRPENEQKATDSHGTHVAGTIAANWNGEGTSGIANGVKIFSVNVFGGNGAVQDMKSNIKGFQFLVDVAQEVNLKAVNCSWGTAQPIFILSVMIDELGRKGVNTVIASGNRYCDLDESIDLGSMTNSEYAIVVNAASMDGKMTDFSCRGQNTTDVFAPGGGIDSITCKGADGEPVEIDCLCSGALKRGCETGAFSNIYQCQWAQLSYNVKGFIEASNELHEMLQKGMEIGTQTWQDNVITADIRSLPNGSHVAAVTNADGAVNRVMFSTSSQDAEGRMLFERFHSVPVLYPAFIADQSHRIYGPMAVSGGRIYTITNTAKYKIAQAIWSYDIEQDSWERLPLPEGCDPQSIRDGAFASLRDRLYLYGTHLSTDEAGLDVSRGCLWRYEPYGDFWEQLEIPMPDNAKGICVLGDELFVVGGSVYGMQLEGAPADNDGAYDAGFYKADLARGALVRVSGKLPDDAAMDNLKVSAGRNRMYIYAEIDDSYYEQPGETPENGITYRKTVSGGKFFRIAYDGAENKITFEELTDTLNETLGDDLRTEYEYKMGGDEPGEHFAIAGLDTGVAIIGSSKAGEDVHIIYDTDEKAVLYDRATCYHKAFDPVAVFSDGRLYVIGYNGTEPDVMYFRSQEMTPQPAANEGGAPGGVSGGGMDTRIIGGVTIGLFAAAVLLLSGMRKKNSE